MFAAVNQGTDITSPGFTALIGFNILTPPPVQEVEGAAASVAAAEAEVQSERMQLRQESLAGAVQSIRLASRWEGVEGGRTGAQGGNLVDMFSRFPSYLTPHRPSPSSPSSVGCATWPTLHPRRQFSCVPSRRRVPPRHETPPCRPLPPNPVPCCCSTLSRRRGGRQAWKRKRKRREWVRSAF